MANQNVQNLRGFRDFLGKDAQKRHWLMQQIRGVMIEHGFEPLETPTLEYKSLLTGKYGEEADKLIYSFTDRGGRNVALRYDQTVPTARIVSQYNSKITFPYKRFQMQNVWRADKPQKGRYREFTQCDADIIGSKSIISDAEILALFVKIYQHIGLESIIVKLNDREQLIKTIRSASVPEKLVMSVIQTIDKLDKKSKEEVIEELIQKGIDPSNAKNLLNILGKSVPSSHLQRIMDLCLSLGVKRDKLQFAPSLARGLDYYTGIIFEGVVPEFSAGSIGAGGRYDNLIGDLLGHDSPACGFAVGFDRTLEATDELGKIPFIPNSSEVLVTVFSPDLLEDSLKTTAFLRDKGIKTECYTEEHTKIDSQLKYANSKGIPFVIITGEREKERGTVLLKNMRNREQIEDTIQNICKRIKLDA